MSEMRSIDPVVKVPVDIGEQPRECGACGHTVPLGGSLDCGLGHEPIYDLRRLMASHRVKTIEALVQILARRIDRLIEKLPPSRDEQPSKTRFA